MILFFYGFLFRIFLQTNGRSLTKLTSMVLWFVSEPFFAANSNNQVSWEGCQMNVESGFVNCLYFPDLVPLHPQRAPLSASFGKIVISDGFTAQEIGDNLDLETISQQG